MNMQSVDLIETCPEEWACVGRGDLYALLDKLTAMQLGLVSLWNPDATIDPLGPAKRLQARDALSTAIVDHRKWIEQAPGTGQGQ